MGQRGPKRMPTALKLARGTRDHNAQNREEPEIAQPTVRMPPAGLSPAAVQEWERLIDPLISSGVLTVADMHTFAEYCELVAEVEQWKKYVRNQGKARSLESGSGKFLQQLRTHLTQIKGHLGLTPSTRSSIKKAKSTANAVDDKRTRFFGARKTHGDSSSPA